MKANNENGAQSATTNNNAQNNVQVLNESAAAKPRSLKCLANDESKAEMYSLPAAVRACKTAYDIKESKTREYLHSIGFTAQTWKAITADDLQPFAVTKSGRFSTWAVLNAARAYSDANDLSGEKAAKEQRKEEQAKLAAARKRIEEQKRAEREKRMYRNQPQMQQICGCNDHRYAEIRQCHQRNAERQHGKREHIGKLAHKADLFAFGSFHIRSAKQQRFDARHKKRQTFQIRFGESRKRGTVQIEHAHDASVRVQRYDQFGA